MKALGCIRDTNVWTASAWPLGLVAVAMFYSFVLACGMPFAALSALAALALPLRTAITTTILGWLANQLVGFDLLTYPIDLATLAWGLALGISTAAAVAAARPTLKLTARLPMVAASGLAFLTVLLTQQALVYPASWMLGSHPSVFTRPVGARQVHTCRHGSLRRNRIRQKICVRTKR